MHLGCAVSGVCSLHTTSTSTSTSAMQWQLAQPPTRTPDVQLAAIQQGATRSNKEQSPDRQGARADAVNT